MKNLFEQPYDSDLLKRSRLYSRSRKLYLSKGGTFNCTVQSAARSLASATLIENNITYSPTASEITWSITDKLQKNDLKHFEEIKSLVANVYHEQNHRYLWHFLKMKNIYCPTNRRAASKYLNFIESLVIILDMALGDELSIQAAQSLKQMNIIYDTGFNFMKKLKTKREYRNALQICLLTTFYLLEGYHQDDIPFKVAKQFSGLEKQLISKSVERAMCLDVLFVELTNPIWQKKYINTVIKKLSHKNKSLILDELEIYRLAEDWLDHYGL